MLTCTAGTRGKEDEREHVREEERMSEMHAERHTHGARHKRVGAATSVGPCSTVTQMRKRPSQR